MMIEGKDLDPLESMADWIEAVNLSVGIALPSYQTVKLVVQREDKGLSKHIWNS